MRTLIKISLVVGGLFLLFSKLIYDLYCGASDSLQPNIANDAFNYAWPFYNFARASVQSGILPLWNPYSSLGTPFFAEIGLGLFYPLTWIILLTDVPSALVLIQFLTVVIGMAGMYFYTSYLELVWPARILSVLLFAYAVFTEAFHPALGSTFCWFPWLLWLTHRFLDSPSFLNVLVIAIVLALCFLAGFPNFFFYTCLILGVYGLILLSFSSANYGATGVALRVGMLIVALVLMLGLVAVQFFPSYELSTLSVRNVEAGTAYRRDSFWEIFSLLVMFRNFFLTDMAYLYANSAIQINAGIYYLGGALLLLPFSFFSQKYRKVSIALSASLIFISLFMLSNQVSVLSFLQKMPLADSLRVNGRGVAYAQFLLIVLAGIGLSVICEQVKAPVGSKSAKRTSVRISLFLAYVAFLASFAATLPHNNWFFVGLMLCTILVVLALLRDSGPLRIVHVGWMLALIIVIDVSAHRNNRFLVPAFVKDDSGFVLNNVKRLKDKPDNYRVLFDAESLAQAGVLDNIGSKYQLPNISAYSGLTLARWENFIRYLVGSEEFDRVMSQSILTRFYGDISPPLLGLLAEDPGILALASLRYRVSKAGTSEDVHALPRAYSVNRYMQTSSEAESLAAIKENLSLLSHTVILESASPTFTPSPRTQRYKEVAIKHYTSNEVELEVSVSEPSIVVLTDAFYPGWSAYVNGNSTKIMRANSVFRAVEVPQGKHSVVFRYDSSSLYWGLVVSLLSAGLIVTLIVGERVFGSGVSEPRR